jgi:curved DNA-binding protein CbpA
LLSLVELEAVQKVIGSLSYYQILKISSVANDEEIQDAFHREALLFHPDRYYGENDPKRLEIAKFLYGKVVAAYQVLSNRTRRAEYDRQMRENQGAKESFGKSAISDSAIARSDSDVSGSDLRGGSGPSSGANAEQDDNAITSVRRRPTGATVGAGTRFFKLAQTAYAAKDFQSARMNIQIALNTDPANPEFLTLSQRVESELKKAKKK